MATDILTRTKIVPVARASYEICNNAIGDMQRVRRHRDSFICWRYGLPRKPEHVRHSTIPGPDDWGTRARLCGPAASQNGQTHTVHEPITEKYSFPVYNVLVRDHILPWTWGPVCTLMITHTHTLNNNCIVTVLQCASGQALLHNAFMTANALTQFPIQMIPGAPLSAVEARSWSLSKSDVKMKSWIGTSTIPHSLNEVVQLQTGKIYRYDERYQIDATIMIYYHK
jgi:hypothetical protein